MKHKSVKILIITGVLLIISAIALAGYNVMTDMKASIRAYDLLAQMDIKEMKTSDITDGTRQLQEVEIDDIWCIGTVEFPSWGTALPVAGSWDESTARIAPCRYSGSPYSNDMIIAGHNYRSHFGKLRSISIGDPVTFIDLNGNAYWYTVTEVEVVDGDDIEAMKSGDWDLTLFTCTIGGQSRVTVRCQRQ